MGGVSNDVSDVAEQFKKSRMNVTSLKIGISISEFNFKLFPQNPISSNRFPARVGLPWSGREPFVRELLIRGC